MHTLITHSQDMLNVTDGQCFINKEVVTIASKFYTKLRLTIATFNEDSVGKLVAHITSLMEKLDVCKQNIELRSEVTDFQ